MLDGGYEIHWYSRMVLEVGILIFFVSAVVDRGDLSSCFCIRDR
jgi:hypothetical protein